MITASDAYNVLANGAVRPLDWGAGVSFTKARNADINWFTLDQSELNGVDLLAEDEHNPIQVWDAYDYQDVADRVVDMNISRSVQFPYNIQSAIADFTLNNYDGYFSIAGAGGTSPISQYIIPKRPCRLYLGFKGAGVIPQFVGVTQNVPDYDGFRNERAIFTAMDFLSEIGEMQLQNMVMMRDVTTDQVIAVILEQFGIAPQMFNLDKGINRIPFVYFEKGKNAGNALRELIQAENGALWLDEQGIIRFESRTAQVGKEPVMTFNGDNVIDIKPSRTSNIVNTVSITAEIRSIVNTQPVFTQDNSYGYQSASSEDNYRVPANGSLEVWLNFDDPVWRVNNLVLNGAQTNSNYVVVNLSGGVVTSGITASGELFATSYKLTVTNTNNYPVSVYSLQLWGQPAKMLGGQPIEYQAQDSDSVEKYGNIELSIADNKCFGSVDNCRRYAANLLKEYSTYSNTLELEVKGNPALQMQDIVTLDVPNYSGYYLVQSISHKLTDAKLESTMTIRKTTLTKPFILDYSVLNGTDLLT